MVAILCTAKILRGQEVKKLIKEIVGGQIYRKVKNKLWFLPFCEILDALRCHHWADFHSNFSPLLKIDKNLGGKEAGGVERVLYVHSVEGVEGGCPQPIVRAHTFT